MDGLTTGKLAKRAGVKLDTVRFYEQKRLLNSAWRSESGYRYFPESAVRRIAFIKGAQQLGFSLEEIRELLALQVQPGATCADVRRRTQEKLEDIEARIRRLRAIRAALKHLTDACQSGAAVSGCTILEGLEQKGWKEHEKP